MDRTLDIGAIVLFLIFAGTLGFLVYFLFDIKRIYSDIKTQKYLKGYPLSDKVKPADGIIEVRNKEVAFKEPAGEKEYFTIPLDRINNVFTRSEGDDAPLGVLGGLSNVFAEREYLYIEFNHDDKWHTVQFSTHKASNVNYEVMHKILEARSNLSPVQ